ncbi:anaerobic ribonucleoside-triphosphate reductase activating protein [Alloiococcus sp. CFN-8]|uniref:anaerobic ribonucleoside-triphosphate reductase activating protein n=1 Tax=Alloiococcus sp. CFN-8 TaxID=3416081 RepID=UPI003CF56ED9
MEKITVKKMEVDRMENKIRLAGILKESLVNGPGMRRVFFSQGCSHDCIGCFNPDTHDFNGGFLWDRDELIKEVLDNPLLKGVTFSGGDPFEQPEAFGYMAENLKKHGVNIWSYTGYTFEYLVENMHKKPYWEIMLNSIDVLVDGKFQEELKEDNLKYRGSSNQRIIDVRKSLANKTVITVSY